MPSAPPPTYSPSGRQAGSWLIVCRYDDVKDVLTGSWTRDATPTHSRGQGAFATPGTDLAAHLEKVWAIHHDLHDLRLF